MTGRAKKAATGAAPKKKANGYKMPAPISTGEVIHDTLMKKKWRIGPSIGVGGFGEIYSACEHENSPKKGSNYPYVVKIEPHENGPLFVEKHFYIRNSNREEINKFTKAKKLSNLGMPLYFGNGSHEYKGEKYRYLVLERYGTDVWTLFKDAGRAFSTPAVFQLGLQMLDVLEYIHSRGYVHADIKGANILMGLRKGTENQAYLVDFGLATRVNDKEFKPDPKCAHNGTIEYTSRDAHLGVPTMRGDLEILGYNMLQWIVGDLPWEKHKQPKTVQTMKEDFLKNVRTRITKDYPNVPDALIQFFEYINSMKPKDSPDYAKCQTLFLNYLKSEGKNRTSKIDFTPNKKTKTKRVANGSEEEPPKARRGRKPKAPASDDENEAPSNDEVDSKQNGNIPKPKRVRKPKPVVESEEEASEEETIKTNKRKSTEPDVITKLKKTKLSPKATPPAKKNHVNIATQTSVGKSPRNKKLVDKRQVSFDSPICEIIGTRNSKVDSSGDIFDDSFVIEEKKPKPRKKLLSDEDYTVKKVVRKKTTTVQKPAGKSWRDCPTIMNGRSPP